MAMDPLSHEALKSLVEKALPKLHTRFKKLLAISIDKRKPEPDLAAMLRESLDLLEVVSRWVYGDKPEVANDDEAADDFAMIAAMEADRSPIGATEPAADTKSAKPLAPKGQSQEIDEELSDEDAAMLMATEGEGSEQIGENSQSAQASEDAEDEISDEDAALLMNSAPPSATKPQKPAAQAANLKSPPAKQADDTLSMIMEADGGGEDEELSEEEAVLLMGGAPEPQAAKPKPAQASIPEEDAAMLAAVGGDDEEIDDDEARRLLAEMDGGEPETPQTNPKAQTAAPKVLASEEMDDDEARRLLAEMDGGSSGNSKGEMSDDEAQNLLAAMDGPAPAKSAPAAKAPPTKKASSADDEAAALLAKLGGGDFEDDDEDEAIPPQKAAPPPQQQLQTKTAPAASGGDDLMVEEINEWEPNDFQTDQDMVSDFNQNCSEIMEVLDEQVLALESDPSSTPIIEEIFRAAHTLKGAAGMFGFKGLERIVHRMENLFDLIRKGKLTPTSDIIDVMFSALDVVRVLLEAVKKGQPCGVKTADVVRDLTLVAEGKKAVSGRGGASAKSDAESAPRDHDETEKPAPKATGDKKDDKNKEVSTIRVDLNRLDALVNLIGELVIDRTRFVTIEDELRTKYPEVKLSGNISETVQLFGRHMNEIQDIIMKVRMVPIGNAFNKYTRIVRDLSKQLGKQIDLHISGENAELDKTLVEQIGDPLIHLIRNSCDHGVETPDVRKQAGKNPRGSIYLSAHQEGNHIVITIEDDGKGIPVDIIRKKGIEKGLISADDKLTNREIFNLIFEPGFSTAEKVTNVSGRGVGMDVVKKQIMKLKGQLDVESELGRGTTITIRLPLTLAIVQSLLIRAKEERFAIPLGSVIESIRIRPEEIQRVGDAEVIKLRDKVLRLMHLDRELNLVSKKNTLVDHINDYQESQDQMRRNSERHFVVVVGSPERPFGILVDQLLNQQEMVIKSMGRIMRGIPGVSGGAVLGNGEVVLVLDIAELEQTFTQKNRGQIAA